MKISELPEDVRIKALEYQSKDGTCLFSDNLTDAFNWKDTNEGFCIGWIGIVKKNILRKLQIHTSKTITTQME